MTRWLAAVAALVFLGAGAARAQESFGDLGGTWWFKVGGEDAGALLMAVSAPHAGSIDIEDTLAGASSFGFSRALGAFFVVPSGQTLGFDSKRRVVGTLELTDPDTGDPAGTLELERSKANKKFTSWKIRASIDGSGAGPVSAKLKGKRLPETFPVLSGGNPETRLSGKGVKSKAFDLHVTSDTVLGLPAYGFDGAGPVEIDDVETPDATISGRFMLSPKYELFGLLEDSSHFGTGDAKGKLKLPEGSLVPKLKLVVRADRKLTAKGRLTEPVDPVLSVTPTTLDFGALHIGASQETSFAVTNVGAGLLSGEASFLDGNGGDFSFASDEDYLDLTPDSPAHNVTLRFAPTSQGTKTEQILFDVGGGRVGAQIVTVTGVGGIAVLSVAPDEIAFADTSVGVAVFESVTITNTGDGILAGRAVITGSSDFAVALLAGGGSLPGIDYELDPGEELTFFVRFLPSAIGDQTATLTLTGGGGASVPLSGGTP